MRPEEVVSVIGLSRVRDGDPDRVEWICDLVSEEQGVLEDFRVWIALEDVRKLPRPESAADRWVEEQIEDFAQRPFASSEAASPLRLRL